MALKYNKQIIKKDRSIQTRGPRDHQIAQSIDNASIGIISELKSQIIDLQGRLGKANSSDLTDEELDAEIINAVKSETKILNTTISELKDKIMSIKEMYLQEIESLRVLLKDKDVFIDQLKVNKTNKTNNSITHLVLDRPELEEHFIDPIEKEKNINLESHISIDKVQSEKKVLDDKVEKLKKLLNKK